MGLPREKEQREAIQVVRFEFRGTLVFRAWKTRNESHQLCQMQVERDEAKIKLDLRTRRLLKGLSFSFSGVLGSSLICRFKTE